MLAVAALLARRLASALLLAMAALLAGMLASTLLLVVTALVTSTLLPALLLAVAALLAGLELSLTRPGGCRRKLCLIRPGWHRCAFYCAFGCADSLCGFSHRIPSRKLYRVDYIVGYYCAF